MLQTKALYNLLRLNAEEDPSISAEPWAVEDLRKVPLEKLFERLKKAGVDLDLKSFAQFAEGCDTPEDLSELLLSDLPDEKLQDALYLVIFEIWRRLLPEKQSLSIFCDELDYQISQYDQDALESDEQIQDGLANLLEILDENADGGADPSEIYATVSNYFAHDLESFLYDYIADLLDNGNLLYASELIEGFSTYVSDRVWFDFLRVRLISVTDIGKANHMLHQILEEKQDLSLIFEMIHFLAVNGEHELFTDAVKKALPLMKKEEEFLELLEVSADFFRRLDLDEMEQAIQKIINKRKGFSGQLKSSDPDLRSFEQMLIPS